MWTEFPTLRRHVKADGTNVDDFYTTLLHAANGHRDARTQFGVESRFHKDKTPYYAVHTGVANGLSKVSLDIDSGHFKLPLPTLELKFKEPGWGGIKSILAAEIKVKKQDGIAIYTDAGEKANGLPLVLFSVFEVKPGRTVESTLDDVPLFHALTAPERALMRKAAQLTLAVCLVGRDDPMVAPDVLTADRTRLTNENRERLAAKAHKRGKIGWILGDDENTMSPHYRCSHFAIRWTGRGRTVARIVQVKASIVHRGAVAAVPTGFGGAGS